MTIKIEDNKWKNILTLINQEVTPVSFRTWFEPLIPLNIDEDNNIFNAACTDSFKIDVINQNKRYIQVFEDSIKQVYNKEYAVNITHKSEEDIEAILKEEPAPKPVNKVVASIDEDNPYKAENYLNPKYNFDNFIVGPNNNYAHAVALAVAEAPAKEYNPLFLYGGSGLGKTHLMHAIGHYIMEHNPDKKVLYVSSEMFTNELVRALMDKNKNSRLNSFKSKYRSVDVLLIDDIQFIEDKESTQTEFFHTFNTLYDLEKQIVISSDRHPSKLTELDDRLKSRFQWNIVADIQPPDFETRVAILRTKAEEAHIILDKDAEEALDLIAEKVKFNIRELESALTRLISHSVHMNEKITPKLVKKTLTDLFSQENSVISCESVKKAVCKFYGIKLLDIESSKRKREFAYPRQVAMYLCREMTDLSLPKIGKSFGGRDHTTVLHACEKISQEKKTNPQLVEEIKKIKENI